MRKPKATAHDRKAATRQAENETLHRAGTPRLGKPGTKGPYHTLAGAKGRYTTDVADEDTYTAGRERRKQRLLGEAKTARRDAETTTDKGERAALRSAAERAEGLAESATAHAEADATEAGYGDDIATVGRDGRFYVIGRNKATGHRLAWPGGRYTPRYEPPKGSDG